MTPITPRQQAVLTFIREHIARLGYAPTLAEVGGAFGFCANAAGDHVRALERKLYVASSRMKSRTIRLLQRFIVLSLDGELLGVAVAVDSSPFDDLG